MGRGWSVWLTLAVLQFGGRLKKLKSNCSYGQDWIQGMGHSRGWPEVINNWTCLLEKVCPWGLLTLGVR